MSSSSLTALPSSDPPLSDRTLQSVEVVRPVARRTYGRRREASPVADADGPSLGALFTSSDSIQPDQISKSYQPRESPSKALLNRFASSATGWRTSLVGLGADIESADDEPDNDDEALKRELARLRQEARGGKPTGSSSRSVDLPAPIAITIPHKVPVKKLHATSSTSTLTTLTTLPTSPLRSSPPLRSSEPAPAPPVPAQTNDLAAMFDESSDEETRAPVRGRSVSPSSERSTTPTPAMGPRRSTDHSPTKSPKSPPSLHQHRTSKQKANRLQAFVANLDNEVDDAAPAIAGPSKSSPRRDMDDFLATLRQDDDEQDGDDNDERLVKQTSSLSVALFDDEEDQELLSTDRRSKKVKSLAKKEMAQMHKDVAAAKRERQYHPFKPEVDHLPISSWAQDAYKRIIKASEVPTLVEDDGLPASSPLQVTPDEITAFTPSSTARPGKKAFGRKPMAMVPGTSSPSPIVLGEQANRDPTTMDDEAELSLDAMLERDLARLDQKDVVEERRKVLQRRKEAALREAKWVSKPEKGYHSSDDELSIIPKAKQEQNVRFEDVKPAVAHRTAKSVLDNYKSSNGMTKSRQAVLPMTARKSSPHVDMTETLAAFAGKTFKHADLRATNGGSRPAGQKRNRDAPVHQLHLNDWMTQQHLKQARLVRERKEAMFNVKKKQLPPKQVKLLEEELEALAAREAAGPVWDDEDGEDEDEDDEDFELSGSGEDVGDDEAEVLQYSGDEAEEVDEATAEPLHQDTEPAIDVEDHDSETASVQRDEDKENETPLASTDVEGPIDAAKSQSSRPSLQAEIDTPRASRVPLGEIQPDAGKATPQPFASTYVDVGGFGSGGGSPGFSQLFEATQAAGPSAAIDAFAGLRDQNEALLPTQALLPQVEISKTQIERDNAMIAGDGDDDDDAMDHRPKTQYLNEQGFFTQTKPLQPARNTSTTSANLLAGSSELLEDHGADYQPAYDLSSTQRGTSEGELDEPEAESIPRSQTPVGSVPLAPSSKDDDMDAEDADQDPFAHERSQPQPVDAFAKLMSAGQRPLTKHQKRAKALIRSNLVDEQAEESEEDDWLMPGQKSDDEDDNDGEEDAYLADLVNDDAVNEEEKRKQDALVAAKVREVQMADDAKREAEARKITEGEYRHKRRGKDFYSDDEDGSPRKKRWSKKERRARKAWKEDGLEKLDGETNVFHAFYDNDLDSDVESVEEVPSPRKKATPSPQRTREEKMEMLRRVARMNKEGVTAPQDDELELDNDLGFGRSLSEGEGDGNDTDTEPVEETQYSITRLKRVSAVETVKTSSLGMRTESLSAFVKDEAQISRRTGPAAYGSSVVRQSHDGAPVRGRAGGRPSLSKASKAIGGSSTSNTSILLSKTSKFA